MAIDTPGVAAPPLAEQRIGDISGVAFVGSADTWFIGARGGRWAGTGGRPDFRDGAYFLKVGIYTLDPHPPAVTVRRTDGLAKGRASFHPVSEGLPRAAPDAATNADGRMLGRYGARHDRQRAHPDVDRPRELAAPS